MTNKLKTTASTPETPRGQWFLEMVGIEGLQYPKLVFRMEDGDSLVQINGWQTALTHGVRNECIWFVDIEVGGMEQLEAYEDLERRINAASDEMMKPSFTPGMPRNLEAEQEYARLQTEQAALRKSLTHLSVKHKSYGGFNVEPLDRVALLGEIRLKLRAANSPIWPTVQALDEDLWREFCEAAMAYGNLCYADAAEPPHPDALSAQEYGEQAAAVLATLANNGETGEA